jgi:hypothetical protein
VLRSIFGLKRGIVTGGWAQLQKGELRNLCTYYFQNIIRVIQSRRVRRDGDVARIEEMKN